MKRIVTLLIVFLIALSINGCGQTVYEKCVTPTVPKPKIDNSKKSNVLLASKQCVQNYLVMRSYAEKLEKANGVCK